MPILKRGDSGAFDPGVVAGRESWLSKISFGAMNNWGKILIIAGIAIILLIGLWWGGHFLLEQYASQKLIEKTNEISMTFNIVESLDAKLVQSENNVISNVGKGIKFGAQYILGINLKNSDKTTEKLTDSDIILLLCMWGIFVLVLKDLIAAFGMFKENTSILVTVLLVIAMANLGLFSGSIQLLMRWFAGLAGFTVVLVFFSIIFFAVVAHLGVETFAMAMMRRQAALKAIKMEGKGDELAATVDAFMKAGEALKR